MSDNSGLCDLGDPYTGVLDADFYDDLDAWSRREVTFLAEVAEAVSPMAFTVVSPDAPEVGPVLVVATEDAGDVDLQAGQSRVIAATPVQGFDAEVVTDELGLPMRPEQLAEWGAAFLVATVLEPAR